MRKDQVTIAVQASGLTGPLYSPRLLVTLGVKDGVHELVILEPSCGGLIEQARYEAPGGPLNYHTAILWCALAGDSLYQHLCIACGIQGELEDMPSSARPPAS